MSSNKEEFIAGHYYGKFIRESGRAPDHHRNCAYYYCLGFVAAMVGFPVECWEETSKNKKVGPQPLGRAIVDASPHLKMMLTQEQYERILP